MSVFDDSQRYGRVTQALHWGMAVLLFWQLLTVAARVLIKDVPFEQFTWSTHRPVGFLLFVLIMLRGAWALANLNRRPPSVHLAAKLGHITLYLLMLVVPALALLRQYGSGRAFEPFGIPVFPGFEGDRIDWMIAPGSLLHSWLGWLLFTLIVGHVIMAFWHRRRPDQPDVLHRMWH